MKTLFLANCFWFALMITYWVWNIWSQKSGDISQTACPWSSLSPDGSGKQFKRHLVHWTHCHVAGGFSKKNKNQEGGSILSCINRYDFFSKFLNYNVVRYFPTNMAQMSALMPELICVRQTVGLLPNWWTMKDARMPVGKSSTAAIVAAVTMS